MFDQEAQNKHNFLTWYINATDEDKKKARRTDEAAYEKFLKKYKYVVMLIDTLENHYHYRSM